ncbi:MAG: SOS response-associated peptidase family protein, partial [Myxococcaceae bacterium]
EPVRSCTIITTMANSLVAPLHDRMPVIIPRAQYSRWLGAAALSPDELALLVRPCPPDELEAFEVSSLVNSPKNDVPGCVAPVAPLP